MPEKTMFNVTKVKTGKNDAKIYSTVGTAIIHESGKTGVLFLNWLDGDFALFPKDRPEQDEPQKPQASNSRR